MKFYHLFSAFAAAAFACTGAFAQTPGTATNHAFLIGKGAGTQGYTSLLCTSAQLAVGQASADPICKTITGDVTISAAGVTAIGATVVHSSMLNADVFSTAHSWSATQSFPNNSLTLAEFPTIGASTVIGSVAGGTPVALTQTQITALINAATASLSGALPAWPNNTTTYFRGDGTYATLNFAALGGQATLAQFPTGVSDTALGYWGSTAASAIAINNCTGALTYSTTTHSFGCNSSAGTGTVTSVTPGAGIVSSVATACSQTAITTSGTLSAAECVNAQTGTTYAIVDGDRAKLITASNAAAQAYSIAQAGAASAFASGWFADIRNKSTATAGVVTITPATSTIDGKATYKLFPGQSIRIVSDGTNYQVENAPALTNDLVNSLGADVTLATTYVDGPSVAQGTTGTWLATGAVTFSDSAAATTATCKLWDGTTVISSARASTSAAAFLAEIHLSGVLSAPAANIKITCKAAATTKLVFNSSGESKDSTLTVVQIAP